MDSARGSEKMRIASIDIGTNTLLLLVADIDKNSRLDQVHHEQRFPRIGRDVDASGRISIGAFDRTSWILLEYINLARQLRSDVIVACATSAVRDAENKNEFLTYLEKTTSLQIQVLSAEAEAQLTYRGVTFGMSDERTPVAVLDIGGGSTEMIMQERLREGSSFQNMYLQVGAVRITERFFTHDPPTAAEQMSARAFIREIIAAKTLPSFENIRLMGVAGTVTTLVCLERGLKQFIPEKVEGYHLSRQSIESWSNRLASMSSGEILTLSEAAEGRSDILAAGAMILHEIMKTFNCGEIVASIRGLRHGFAIVAWEELNRHSTP